MIKDVYSLPPFVQFLLKYIRIIIFVILAGLYTLAFFFIRGKAAEEAAPILTTEAKIVKLVDIQEYIPPPPPTQFVQIQQQPVASEIVEEVDEIVEQEAPKTNIIESNQTAFAGAEGDSIEYLPQHKITEVPVFPVKDVLSQVVYPTMAYKQGIEGVVYLELFIDDEGTIRKIEVLKDPGHGFAEAAVAAFDGIKCTPATANGKPVAVRYRYPIKFKIK